MKKILLFIQVILFTQILIAQKVNLEDKWVKKIESEDGFKKCDIKPFLNYDFSYILSNHLRLENDPISNYQGIFGPKYRKIEFHLSAEKKGINYKINGANKLGKNIRKLNGQMKLEKVLYRKQEYITDTLYIGIFDCVLNEPGDKNGDGVFTGKFSVVFYKSGKKLDSFKTASGDEPNYTNTFVGSWKRNNSKTERKVIFSFEAYGLYESLPFCSELYYYPEGEYSVIKPEYENYGWKNDDEENNENYWWK